jgi:hypothetical protein
VQSHRRADDLADALAGVQRCVRVLEDDLHVAAQWAQLAGAGVGDVVALERDGAVGWVQQPHDAARERRLAAAGLPNQSERLPGRQPQRDVIHRVHAADLALEDDALPDREIELEVVDGDECSV